MECAAPSALTFSVPLQKDYTPNAPALSLTPDQKGVLAKLVGEGLTPEKIRAFSMGEQTGSDPDGTRGVSTGIRLSIPTDPNYQGPGRGKVKDLLFIPTVTTSGKTTYRIIPYVSVLRDQEEKKR